MFELSDENNLDEIPVNVISTNQINGSFDDLTQSITENLTIEQLENLQKVVNAADCDLFDVLSYLAYNTPMITRKQRIDSHKGNIFNKIDEKQKEFLEFVLSKYEEKGIEELDEEKLPVLLNMKYDAIANAEQQLGDVDQIRSIFFGFQENLYTKVA